MCLKLMGWFAISQLLELHWPCLYLLLHYLVTLKLFMKSGKPAFFSFSFLLVHVACSKWNEHHLSDLMDALKKSSASSVAQRVAFQKSLANLPAVDVSLKSL